MKLMKRIRAPFSFTNNGHVRVCALQWKDSNWPNEKHFLKNDVIFGVRWICSTKFRLGSISMSFRNYSQFNSDDCTIQHTWVPFYCNAVSVQYTLFYTVYLWMERLQHINRATSLFTDSYKPGSDKLNDILYHTQWVIKALWIYIYNSNSHLLQPTNQRTN